MCIFYIQHTLEDVVKFHDWIFCLMGDNSPVLTHFPLLVLTRAAFGLASALRGFGYRACIWKGYMQP